MIGLGLTPAILDFGSGRAVRGVSGGVIDSTGLVSVGMAGRSITVDRRGCEADLRLDAEDFTAAVRAGAVLGVSFFFRMDKRLPMADLRNHVS